MKIAVTGGSGKAGRAVVRDLREHGHDVLNVDRVPSHEDAAPFLPADLTDYGQTLEALSGGHVLPASRRSSTSPRSRPRTRRRRTSSSARTSRAPTPCSPPRGASA
jgi:nucleoside-diphosphate-sugar epimerase